MSESTASAAPRPRGEISTVEPSRAERIIGRRAAETRATVPSLELSTRVTLRDPRATAGGSNRALAAAVIAALGSTLRAHPRCNAAYRDGHYEYFSRVNIGVTLIGPGVFATPTIHDADQHGAAAIGRELDAFDARLAAGEELHSAETAGATFTVIDLTPYAGITSPPLITAPQAAALAVALVASELDTGSRAAANGHAATTAELELTLAADQRILWGDAALSFLHDLRKTLTRGT